VQDHWLRRWADGYVEEAWYERRNGVSSLMQGGMSRGTFDSINFGSRVFATLGRISVMFEATEAGHSIADRHGRLRGEYRQREPRQEPELRS
jgi:hypothetical protein